MTPQTLLNDLTKGTCEALDIVLIVVGMWCYMHSVLRLTVAQTRPIEPLVTTHITRLCAT